MLRFEETRITQLLKETIKVICRSADNCSEIAIQGLLGITLDRKEIFLVQIDDVIDKALERTGIPFNATWNNDPTDLNSSEFLSNQSAEQFEPKQDLNLTTGGTENVITEQTRNSISVVDSAGHSLLPMQTEREEKTETEGNVGVSYFSDAQGPQERSSAAVSTSVVMAPTTANKSAFACVSERGRGWSRGRKSGRGRGYHGRGKGRGGRDGGLSGRGRGKLAGRSRGKLVGRGRGKLAVTDNYQNKSSSPSVSDGVSGVPLSDNIRMRTRSSCVSETHRTVISGVHESVNSDSRCLGNLKAGNESQTVGSVQGVKHKTLKTLKQPGFKRKLKPLGVITSKKSKHANCSADSGADSEVFTIRPQVSSSDPSLYECSICRRTFSKPSVIADHYITEHCSSLFTGHATCPASEAVQVETSFECLSPGCSRTFSKQVGMVRHYGRIHGGLPSRRRGRGGLTGARSGTFRKGLRFSTCTNFDMKLPEMNVIGQIIPSSSCAFKPGLCASTERHCLPETVVRAEFSDAEGDGGSLLSSSVIVKQEIDSSMK